MSTMDIATTTHFDTCTDITAASTISHGIRFPLHQATPCLQALQFKACSGRNTYPPTAMLLLALTSTSRSCNRVDLTRDTIQTSTRELAVPVPFPRVM